jgi:hypothetical protein
MKESQDLKVTINIESGFEEVKTPLIKGKLCALIIDSMNNVSVTIDSELGYPIFHNAQHHGVKYYAVRSMVQGWESRLAVYDQFDKFVLNENLNIRVSGPRDSEVNIILRYE